MLRELTCLIIFTVLSALFAILMVLAGFICQYSNKSLIKNSTYECGVIPFDNAHMKFDVKYFNYAILFLIFDVETIFLYPFAVKFSMIGVFSVIEAFIFVTILLFGLFFAMKRKMLRWI
ncbi:MAG: NADH-quinone oxidoreductase subunit A [bacterium]|nr:NADH-quinone oxidoreductase subunit A [bacterium]